MKRPLMRVALAAVAVAVLVAGCSSDAEPSASPSAPVAAPSATPSATPSPTGELALHTSTIAMVKGTEIDVADDEGGEIARTISAEDVLRVPDETPLVFLVKQVTRLGVEVYLPIRPNGSTGWVAPQDVQLYSTDYEVDVYVADFELTISKAGEVVATYPIGVGRDELPTPGGIYFVRELLAQPNPNGVYGPFAYGLSGYSEVLDSFKEGDAIIGIHGTNEPDLIGTSVSHGCIRLLNDDITEIVETWNLPLGVPVHIHA